MTHAVLVNMLSPDSLRSASTAPTDSEATQAKPPTIAPRPTLTNLEEVSPPPGYPAAIYKVIISAINADAVFFLTSSATLQVTSKASYTLPMPGPA